MCIYTQDIFSLHISLITLHLMGKNMFWSIFSPQYLSSKRLITCILHICYVFLVFNYILITLRLNVSQPLQSFWIDYRLFKIQNWHFVQSLYRRLTGEVIFLSKYEFYQPIWFTFCAAIKRSTLLSVSLTDCPLTDWYIRTQVECVFYVCACSPLGMS